MDMHPTYGMCKNCHKTDVNAYLQFHMCYPCRKQLKCYYCGELEPNYLDCLDHFSCLSCSEIPSCAHCHNKKTKGKNKYCTECEKSIGKCLHCKQSNVLMYCGLCKPCEFNENISLRQGRETRKITEFILQTKRDCQTCMKDKPFLCYLEKK